MKNRKRNKQPKVLSKRKKQERLEQKKWDKKHKGWTQLICSGICGCCAAQFMFKSKMNAEKAYKAIHCTHGFITDDEGHREAVDGFYGYKDEVKREVIALKKQLLLSE